MRKIFNKFFSFFFQSNEHESLEIVSSYRDEYKRLDALLLTLQRNKKMCKSPFLNKKDMPLPPCNHI
jgi:hypothetical protein